MTADKHPEDKCLIGLTAIEVGRKFEQIDNIKEKMDVWESEDGILGKMAAGIKTQNGRVRLLERGFIALAAFLAGLGIINIAEFIKGFLK